MTFEKVRPPKKLIWKIIVALLNMCIYFGNWFIFLIITRKNKLKRHMLRAVITFMQTLIKLFHEKY